MPDRVRAGDGAVLRPVADDVGDVTTIGRYVRWLDTHNGLKMRSYAELWRWSITDGDAFWQSMWNFFDVRSPTPVTAVRVGDTMPGVRWFAGSEVNYAEHMLRLDGTERAWTAPGDVAVIAHSNGRDPVELTIGELRDQVRRVRAGLRRLGVGRGDRVVAYLPNTPEALVAFLATASLGAVWASCSPEFGARAVIDRFAQLEPKVMLAVSSYRYGAKQIDRTHEVDEIVRGLPTLDHTVAVSVTDTQSPSGEMIAWDELLVSDDAALDFELVPFDHPLYVLFSSGTTGLPKAIVHGHGGILLEHLKHLGFHWDAQRGDRLLWFTTTAWTMWNMLVSGLLHRAAIILHDGNPLWPDHEAQWALASSSGATLLGTSPAYVMACRKLGVEPKGNGRDLSVLRTIGITGAPLPPDGFDWLADGLGQEIMVNSVSGGTDVCSGFVGGNPLVPVYRGELSAPCLGVDVAAFDDDGEEVIGELGELVVRGPMPSMPVSFWGDDGDQLYRSAYFDVFPGVWRHGDWVEFSARGSCVITGRSDATLNRGGVRLGTAEFYAVVEEIPEVGDSVVVHLEDPSGETTGELWLFVAPAAGSVIDDDVIARIRARLRSELSPRHLPDRVEVVRSVPRTLTGKRLEAPLKRLLRGEAVDRVASRESLADPTALDQFVGLAR